MSDDPLANVMQMVLDRDAEIENLRAEVKRLNDLQSEAAKHLNQAFAERERTKYANRAEVETLRSLVRKLGRPLIHEGAVVIVDGALTPEEGEVLGEILRPDLQVVDALPVEHPNRWAVTQKRGDFP